MSYMNTLFAASPIPSILSMYLPFPLKLLASSSLIAIATYMHVEPAEYVCVFRSDHLGLENLIGGSFLEKTGSPTFNNH